MRNWPTFLISSTAGWNWPTFLIPLLTVSLWRPVNSNTECVGEIPYFSPLSGRPRDNIYIYIYIYIAQEIEDQFQTELYQKPQKWYLMPPCLTLSITRYIPGVKWNNPGKWVAPFPTPWCSSYWKGSLQIVLDNSRKLYCIYIYIINYYLKYKGTYNKFTNLFSYGHFYW